MPTNNDELDKIFRKHKATDELFGNVDNFKAELKAQLEDITKGENDE